MLKIHPNALENFNQKAAQILTFIKCIEPNDVQFPSFDPGIHPSVIINASDVLNDPIHRATDIDNFTVCLYLNSELSIGILEDGCLELRKVVDNLFKIKEVNRKVSIKTLDYLMCIWIKNKFNDSNFCDFMEFLCTHLARLIDEYNIFIPIELLHIEKSFTIGSVAFKPFTKESIDELESRAINQSQDSHRQELAKMLFDKRIREFQGHAIATISLEAESERAYEIAIEETNTALSMLRIFSASAQEPLSYYPCAVWGSSNISRGYLMVLKEGNLNQLTIKTLDRRPMPEYLDNKTIENLFSAGLNILDKLLQLEERNPFQKKLLDSLILYSRSVVSKDIADKLVYILASLESIFLRNNSEPIQQNLGERIAFLIGDSMDKRKRITRVMRDIYGLRSRFVHHGVSINDYEKMREFMMYAWQAIISLIQISNSVQTMDDLLDELDDRKLS